MNAFMLATSLTVMISAVCYTPLNNYLQEAVGSKLLIDALLLAAFYGTLAILCVICHFALRENKP